MNSLQKAFWNSGWFISKINVKHDDTEYKVKVTVKRGFWKKLLNSLKNLI